MHSIKTLLTQKLYPQALKASTNFSNLSLTLQIYALLLKSDFPLDIFLGSSLISYFSKSGHLHHAHNLLLSMPETDTVTWNTLILGYAKLQQTQTTCHLFNTMRHFGLTPDAFTFSSLLKSCKTPNHNEITHGVCFKTGFASNAFITSGLVHNYSKFEDIVSAEKCFRECLVVDTVVWTSMITGYFWNGEFDMAQHVFTEMRLLGLCLNEYSVCSVIGALGDIKEGEKMHCLSIKMGFLPSHSSTLSNAIMSMYCRCGSRTDAVKMFDEIPNLDLVSWTVRIGVAYDGEEAVEVFKLCFCNVGVNEYAIINVLSVIGNSKLLNPGKQIQAYAYKTGYLNMVSIGNALISMYARCQYVEEARWVFDEMSICDCVSWNALISGYVENGLVGLTLGLFSEMQRSFFEPTKFTFASILDVLSNSEASKNVHEIHAQMVKSGFVSDDSMVTCLIRAYGKCDDIGKSKQFFSEIHQKDVDHVNAMLATFIHCDDHVEALKFFRDVWSSKVIVDAITFSMVVKSCGAFATLDQVKILHSLSLKYGVCEDNFLGSSLVDVYCKCGSITDAEMAFDGLRKNDNIAAWNAMIMGYAQHGNTQNVFKLFNDMTVLGMGIDEITYLGVLYSCCHSGLVKEAFHFINTMFGHHNVMPQLEHYACLVDLLGRVGHLEEAKMTIDEMPFVPDAQIWQILLSACNFHGNLELGNVVALRLLELQPENDAAHITLSNLNASVGIWDEVGRLRKVMKEKTITKEPGVSWIQVKGALNSFCANDQSHFENREICLKLQQLNNHMIATLEVEDIALSFLSPN